MLINKACQLAEKNGYTLLKDKDGEKSSYLYSIWVDNNFLKPIYISCEKETKP